MRTGFPSDTWGTLQYFKATTWNALNARTVNGSCFNPKIAKSYARKGIELRMTRLQYRAWCDLMWPVIKEFYESNRTPSLDRIDSSGHYEIGNIRIIDRWQNSKDGSRAGCAATARPTVAIHKEKGLRIEAPSTADLARKLSIPRSWIVRCLRRKEFKSAHGFTFHYLPYDEQDKVPS